MAPFNLRDRELWKTHPATCEAILQSYGWKKLYSGDPESEQYWHMPDGRCVSTVYNRYTHLAEAWELYLKELN